MKKLILASILAVGLGSAFVYANQAALELEHANRLATGDDSVQQDMGNMKAQGKCNTDQTDKRKIKTKKHTPSKAELELEHASRLPTGDDGYTKGMGNMKAQGKCNTDQTDKRKTKIKVHNPSVDELEIEYNEIRTIAEYDDGF